MTQRVQKWLSAGKYLAVDGLQIYYQEAGSGPADPNSGRHMAERYQQELPQSAVYLLSEQIGHWPQLETPGEVVKNLQAFWQECTRAG